MGVVVEAPDGSLVLHVKGADSVMLARLAADTPRWLLDATHDNLHHFATQVGGGGA